MNKFKVGDEVRLKDSITSVYLDNNTVYTVGEVFHKKLRVHGVDFKYNEDTFDLVNGEVNNSSDFLSPLEAADAILHKEPLQEFCEHTGKWVVFACSLKGVTLDMLQNTKFRRKPKTVIINGVEVVAPIDENSIGHKFYVVDVPAEKVHGVHSKYIEDFKHYWATEEDAQKALDAMLIPFDKLNKGDK